MAETGIATTNLPTTASVDAVLANKDGSISAIPILSLASQLAGTGAIDVRFAALETKGLGDPNPKDAAALASTANVSLTGEQIMDGTLTSGTRALLKDQTDASENGIYVTASGAWVRASDMNTDTEVDWASVFVSGGTVNSGRRFQVAGAAIVLDTNDMPWVQIADNTGLQAQLDAKADASALAAKADASALAAKADASALAAKADASALAAKADASALADKASKENPVLSGEVTINDVIQRAAESGVAWGVGDDAGDLLALLTALGILRANGLEIPGLRIIQIDDPVWRFYIGDDDGNIVFGVTLEGDVRTVAQNDAYFGVTAQEISLVYVQGYQDVARSVILTWVSDSSTNKLVEYRLVGASEWRAQSAQRSRAFPNLAGKYIHSAVLPVDASDAICETRWPGSEVTETFKTAPLADVKIAIASDHQNTDFSATGIAGDFGTVVSAEEADLLILNGDYVNDDGQFTTTFGQRWFDFLTQISRDYRTRDGALIPIIGTVGNHEGRNLADTSNALNGGDGTIGMIETIMDWSYDPEQPGRGFNSAATLSVGLELFIITLETDHTVPLFSQQAWFAAQLAAYAPYHRHVAVIGHVPAWMGMETYEFDDVTTQARELRNTFWPIMNQYADKIRFYCCGHEHIMTVTDKLKMNYDAGLTADQNDLRWTTDATDGVRQVGAGPWAGSRYDLNAADMAEVSSIDASPKFIAAMGYDTPSDTVQTHGTGLTNTNKKTWHVWVMTFNSTTFTARAVDRNGLDFYTISESI
jgi:Calcineurin-like phosphoesterase